MRPGSARAFFFKTTVMDIHSSSCPVEALYLELGCVPMRIVIKSRRINYLHHLTTRDKVELIFQFFLWWAQWNSPASRNDLKDQVRKDLKEFGMEEDLKWMEGKSKLTFKKIVKNHARELAFELLMKKKESH